jgi:hypothetical protein
MLEALRPQGYAVFHDVPERGYNIDHVLVGPAGVIVVETKTPSKPVGRESTIEYDGRRVLIDGIAPDRVPIKQVKACADRIREILLAGTNLRPFVRPVVLYPDWWVEPMPKGVEVWVLNQRVLADFLRHEPTHLKPDDVRLLAAALETHIRVSLNAGGI